MPPRQKRNLSRHSKSSKRIRKYRNATYTTDEDEAEDIEHRIAFRYHSAENYEKFSDIGNLSCTCTYCQAIKWKGETTAFCCHNGTIQLPVVQIPSLLHNLITESDPRGKAFLYRLRTYNNLFAMTSIGCEEIREGYMPTFKICGQLYHRVGSLMPETNTAVPKFLQIYFVGESDDEARIRASHCDGDGVDTQLIKEIQTVLHSSNHYVRELKNAHEKVAKCDSIGDVKVLIKESKEKNVHKGRTNLPSASEIAVVLKGEECGNRDIVVEGIFQITYLFVLTTNQHSIYYFVLTFHFQDEMEHYVEFWKPILLTIHCSIL